MGETGEAGRAQEKGDHGSAVDDLFLFLVSDQGNRGASGVLSSFPVTVLGCWLLASEFDGRQSSQEASVLERFLACEH